MCLYNTDSTPANHEHVCVTFWWIPSQWWVVWVNSFDCKGRQRSGRSEMGGSGRSYYSCSKYKNWLWYRHKEVELSERDVCWVKAREAVRRRDKLRKERERSRYWLTQSVREREVGVDRKQTLRTNTHIVTNRRRAQLQLQFCSLDEAWWFVIRTLWEVESQWHVFCFGTEKDKNTGLRFDKETGFFFNLFIFLLWGHLNRPECGYAIIHFVDSAAGGRLERKGDWFIWVSKAQLLNCGVQAAWDTGQGEGRTLQPASLSSGRGLFNMR